MEQLILSQTRCKASQIFAVLYGLHDLSPALGFPEWLGWDPAILYQQQVQEARSGSSCRGPSSLMATWTYCPASSTPSMQPSSPRRWNHSMMLTWWVAFRIVPKHWQDQYKPMGGTVPHSVCKLLNVLEHIEKAFPTQKECEEPKASMSGGGSSKKGMVSFSDPILKKSRK